MIHFDIPGLDKVIDEMVDETYRTFKQAEVEVKQVARIAAEMLVKETPQWTGNMAANWRARYRSGTSQYDEVGAKRRYGFDQNGMPGPGLIELRKVGNASRNFPRRKGMLRGYVGAELDETLATINNIQLNPDSRDKTQSIEVYNATPYGSQVQNDNATDSPLHEGKYIRKINYYDANGPITVAIAAQKTILKMGGKWRV